MPIYMKFDGIDGEVADGTIEIESFSWGVSHQLAGGGGGGGRGKVVFQDFHFVKSCDKSSPKLFEYCATGKHIPKGALMIRESPTRQGGRSHYLKITLQDCLISSYQISGNSHGSPMPSDEVVLQYQKFHMDAGVIDDGGA